MLSFNSYLDKVNSLIMPQVPIKKTNQQQQKLLQKPKFTKTPFRKGTNVLKKYTKFQNPLTKNGLHREYGSYRNKLSTIIKESRVKYFDDYFRTNRKKH